MTKRLITPQDLYQFKLISNCQLSPDGRLAVFCVRRVDPTTQAETSNLWLVPTDGSAPPSQFTFGDYQDRLPFWSPDGRAIAFLSRRGSQKQPQIHLIPLTGGEARPLTNLRGQFGRYRWSPDGTRLVCTVRKTDREELEREADSNREKLGVVERRITRLIYKEDGYGYLPQERWHIWVFDAASGDGIQLTDSDLHDEYDPAWSPDGRFIVYRSNRSPDPDRQWDQADLLIIPAEGGEPRRLNAPPGPKELPRYSPDGRWVAYQQHAGRDRWQNTTLAVVPADGSGPARNLTAHTDLHLAQETLGDMNQLRTLAPAWSPGSDTLYFQATLHGDTRLMAVSVQAPQAGGQGGYHPNISAYDSAALEEAAEIREIIGGPGVVEEFHFDAAGRKLLYLYGTTGAPADLWLRDMDSGESRRLTGLNDDLLAELHLSRPEEVWYTAADGETRLQGWILTPPDFDPARQYPSILEIHGGPAVQYGHCFTHEFQYLAAQGYVVYFTNPRGGRGYGQAHTRAIYNNWGGPDYADLMAFVDEVQRRPYIDPARMGVTGGSYGGFMTLWIIGHTQRFKAAVAQRSLSNMLSMGGSSDLAYRINRLFGADLPVWEDFDNYWRQSPLKYIGNAKTPTLIIHSEQDHRCDQEQGEQAYVALKMLGIPTELILFPAEGHGLSRGGRTDRRIARLRHMLRWFDAYLK
ncbi:MAG: S9 family peptidase [Anaerolineae bacterium]